MQMNADGSTAFQATNPLVLIRSRSDSRQRNPAELSDRPTDSVGILGPRTSVGILQAPALGTAPAQAVASIFL